MAKNISLWLSSFLLVVSSSTGLAEEMPKKAPLGYGLFKHVATSRHIPVELLYSVCLHESGRKRKNGDFAPWPWTLNIAGKSYYYDTYSEVYQALTRHINSQTDFKSKYLVDVGMCQVNLYWHRDKLDLSEIGLKRLLLPEHNVDYAALYISQLWKETQSLSRAIGHYHSRTKHRSLAYQQHIKNKMEQVF